MRSHLDFDGISRVDRMVTSKTPHNPRSALVVLVFLLTSGTTLAFTPTHSTSPVAFSTSLSSSLGGGGGDDELSKLISKRSQIKRKKKEDTEPTIDEPLTDLNLDSLPQFKTERPVRRKKVEKDDDNDEQEEEAKPKSDLPIIDYMADYEDENELHIPNRICVSTECWGDVTKDFVPKGKLTKRQVKLGKFVPGDIQLAHTQLLEGGITFFESSPSYGAASRKQRLSALDILKTCISEQADDLPETSIILGLGASPWSKASSPIKGIVGALEDSLDALKLPLVEVYEVPKTLFFPSSILAKALGAAVESGQCNVAGVQGVTSARSLRRLKNKLEALEVQLVTNTFEYSLTNSKNEKLIDICKAAGVIPLIRNPLDDGLASGVYTATNPSGGQQGTSNKFSFKQLEKLQPLHSVLETVVDRVATRVRREMRDTQDRYKSRYGPPPKINTEISTTQVSLNYVIAKGGVPLVPVNTPKQAQEVLGCLGWQLASEEVDMLDAAVSLCK